MALQRYNLDKMLDWMSDDFFRGFTPEYRPLLSLYNRHNLGNTCPMDIIEHATTFEVIANCPGLSEDQISVETKDGYLTIAGEQTKESIESFESCSKDGGSEDKGGSKYHYQERSLTKFSRSFKLPGNVNTNEISAHLDKGVLRVVIAKLPQDSRKRATKVKINTPLLTT